MRIGTKLSLGFGIVIILFLIVGFAGWYAIEKSGQKAEELYVNELLTEDMLRTQKMFADAQMTPEMEASFQQRHRPPA